MYNFQFQNTPYLDPNPVQYTDNNNNSSNGFPSPITSASLDSPPSHNKQQFNHNNNNMQRVQYEMLSDTKPTNNNMFSPPIQTTANEPSSPLEDEILQKK